MLDHADIMNATFVSRYADGRNLTSVAKMNLWHKLAKTLLSSSYSHLTGGLDKKAAVQHEIDVEEWSLAQLDISCAKDVSQYVVFVFLDPIHSCLY